MAVLMGGRAAERHVSKVSGRAAVKALTRLGHRVRPFDPSSRRFPSAFLQARRVLDVAFLALHGPGGEDGSIQGWLETVGVPYTGSGVLASALAMHKPSSKRVFEGSRIPTPPWSLMRRGDPPLSALGLVSLPVIIKPASQGSALGVTIVRAQSDVPAALREGFRYDREVVVERFIRGREITVGVLGDMALPVIEVFVRRPYPFYTYKARYTPGATRHAIPARLSLEASRRIQGLAVAAHRALGCRGATRADFVVTKNGEAFLLEVNTIPGLTPTSLLPDAARAAGMSFEELIQWMVDDALRSP